MKNHVNVSTGEVIEFRSMWSNPFGFNGQDLSNEFEDVFTELVPFAVDPNTGDIINKSSQPVVISKGKINVHDKIQSFASEVDLYKILERFAYSGDSAIVNAKEPGYGDISDIPDNLNDLSLLVNKQFKKLSSINPELAQMVLDENVSSESIQAKANEIYQMRLDDYIKKGDVKTDNGEGGSK